MSITIRACTSDDLHRLQEISIETFTATFGNDNEAEHLNA